MSLFFVAFLTGLVVLGIYFVVRQETKEIETVFRLRLTSSTPLENRYEGERSRFLVEIDEKPARLLRMPSQRFVRA